MNVFAALGKPIVDRPGSGVENKAAEKKRREKIPNPFGLTGSECRVMAALAEVGKIVPAAEKLGMTEGTVSSYLTTARRKIGAANRVLAILEWDRFSRGPGA